VPAKFDGHFVSNEFPIFDVDENRATAEFLALSFRSRPVWESLAVASRGLGNRRQRVHPRDLLAFEVWLPPLTQQLEFVESLTQLASWRAAYEEARTVVSALESSFLNRISGEAD
jgi:type I restriction enzyme S subunit